MKTKKLILLIVVLLVTLLIVLVACQEDEVDITYSDWAIDKLPTYKQPGQISRTASTGAICIFPLPVLSSEDYVKCVSKEATCEEKGEDTYTICALG